MLLSRQGHLLWTLVTQKQEEEEDEEAGSLLVSKQRKLQWSVEAGGSEEPGDDRYHIANSSDTEALVYTVHFEKRRFIFNSSVSVGQSTSRSKCASHQKIKKHFWMC